MYRNHRNHYSNIQSVPYWRKSLKQLISSGLKSSLFVPSLGYVKLLLYHTSFSFEIEFDMYSPALLDTLLMMSMLHSGHFAKVLLGALWIIFPDRSGIIINLFLNFKLMKWF